MATIKEQSPTEPLAIEDQFRALVDVWKAGRGPSSFAADVNAHPAYQQIIALGKPVVPLILRELECQPDHWFAALRAITGENPVPAECRGDVRAMADAWLRWGRLQGLHW
jgi:hypothetical protein